MATLRQLAGRILAISQRSKPAKEGREKLVALLQEKYPTAPQTTGRSRVQISNFVTSITEGDLVLAADGNTVIGIGRVTGNMFTFRPPFFHITGLSNGCRSTNGRRRRPRGFKQRFVG